MRDLIDYSGESTDDNPIMWSQKAFKKYFIETYHKIHNVGGAVPWSIKETVALSRMCGEFNSQDLMSMIMFWHLNTPRPAVACQFINFYSDRVNIYHKMKKTTEDYSWD